MMIKQLIHLAGAALSAVLLLGCMGEHGSALPKLSEEPGAAMHAVKSSKLKEVMHDLNNIVFERFYSEIDRDKMRVRYSKEIAGIVASMSKDIKTIQETGNELDLTEEQRLMFKTLAMELEQEGENLTKIATEYRTESIRPAIDRLVNTCNRCHGLFREKE